MRRITAPLIVTALLAAGSVVVVAQTPPSLEGQAAPRLEGRLHIGPHVPNLDELKGKIVLIFFWAHWCTECRAEGPSVAKLADKYRAEGLVLIAPTERYGYVEGGRPAPPDRELRYIIQIRDTHYPFLRDVPVPVGGANHKAYGADAIPLHVLIDRKGIVRHYHTGRMTEEELDAAIRQLL